MLDFDLYNHTRKTFSKKLFENVLKNAETILIKEKKINSGQKLFIELNLVGNSAITHINKQYRRKNQPTDVISLSYLDRTSKNAFIGEIFISVSYATKQARELGFTLNKELQFLFIHGLLHIFGYDHENPTDKKKMERLTERILV